jgi:ABC-type branched-subunit amino acid transport system substrate-binding protein
MFTVAVGAMVALVSPVSAGAQASSSQPVKVMITGGFDGVPASSGSGNVPQAYDLANLVLTRAKKVNGQPIQVIKCNDQGSADLSQACARQAVSEGVTAVLAPFVPLGGANLIPTLEPAGIPYLGNRPTTPIESTSKDSFPIGPGASGDFTAAGLQAGKNGCKNLGIVSYTVAASSLYRQFATQALTRLGKGTQVLDPVIASTTQADYAPIVQSLSDKGADCVLAVITPTDVVKLVQAVKASGKQMPIAGVTGQFNDTTLATMGTAADGSIVASDFQDPNGKTAAMTKYRKDLKKLKENHIEQGLQSWAAANLFLDVAKGVKGNIDHTSFANALNNAKNVNLGVMAPLDFTKENPSPNYPRIFNRQVYVYQAKNGKLVPIGKGPVDVSGAYPSA